MASKAPAAKMIGEDATSGDRYWLVQWPSRLTKQGKAYRATTIRGELAIVTTAAHGRSVQRGVMAKIWPEISAAIAAAS